MSLSHTVRYAIRSLYLKIMKTKISNVAPDYIPFSEQWEKEMMKFDKKALIQLLKVKLQFIQANEKAWNYTPEIFREFLMRSQFAFPQSEEDLNHWNDGLSPQMMERFLDAAELSLEDIKVPNQGWD